MKKLLLTIGVFALMAAGCTPAKQVTNVDKKALINELLQKQQEIKSSEIDVESAIEVDTGNKVSKIVSDIEGKVILEPTLKADIKVSFDDAGSTPSTNKKSFHVIIEGDTVYYSTGDGNWEKQPTERSSFKDIVTKSREQSKKVLTLFNKYLDKLSLEEKGNDYIVQLNATDLNVEDFFELAGTPIPPQQLETVKKGLKIKEFSVVSSFDKTTKYQKEALVNLKMEITDRGHTAKMNVKADTKQSNINKVEFEVPKDVKEKTAE